MFLGDGQHDAAECLRQLLRCTGMGQRYCDSQADVVDGSVVICYTPESAQVSAGAAAVDARGLLLEATTGDRALKLGAQVLAIRVENTYEQGGEIFWVDAQISWPSCERGEEPSDDAAIPKFPPLLSPT